MDINADNITFVSPITETDLSLPNGDYEKEPQWYIGNSSTNFTIQGAYWGGNQIFQDSNSTLFKIEQSGSRNIAIRNYYIKNAATSN
jgi:hypothetical protein